MDLWLWKQLFYLLCQINNYIIKTQNTNTILKKGTAEVKVEFYDKEACEGCILKPGYCKGKKYWKVIVGGGELALKMEEKALDFTSIY